MPIAQAAHVIGSRPVWGEPGSGNQQKVTQTFNLAIDRTAIGLWFVLGDTECVCVQEVAAFTSNGRM